ncbi:unnamed protein product [Citrullus colocynthis]|uniref:Uncharacterized protein n=1 Tax=Citrullus colocynthis TaxID=252529 RepID=A0ABP0Y575_9ROSI
MIIIIIIFFNFFSSLTQLRLTKPLGQSSIFFVSTFFCEPSVNGSWMILENLIHAFVDAIKYPTDHTQPEAKSPISAQIYFPPSHRFFFSLPLSPAATAATATRHLHHSPSFFFTSPLLYNLRRQARHSRTPAHLHRLRCCNVCLSSHYHSLLQPRRHSPLPSLLLLLADGALHSSARRQGFQTENYSLTIRDCRL